MNRKTATARKRLEAQGFVGLSDDDVRRLNYWLRLAPAICLAWTAVGVALASPLILAMLVPFAFLGGMSEGHPFDMIFNYGIRHLVGLPELPEYGVPRRFACLMASVVISLTAMSFSLGFDKVAYVLGGTMILMASVNVTTGFCVPSAIYGLIFGGPATCEIERSGAYRRTREG